MPRLFFGLEVPAAIRQRLLEVKAPVSNAKWQSSEQLHITLLFLGRTEEQNVAAVRAAARDIPVAAFELDVVGLGCFGQPRSPRNLWVGVQPAAPVAGLHDALKGRMESLGFTAESRAFRPHITLARFKRPPGSVGNLLAQHGESVFGQFPVNQFALFESKQGSAGSMYSVVERFPLQGSD
ncbi:MULTISPECIES: RNA 2',3'-cyclic phosphodiesterase [Marinobacter]|uniref:RNA 2',3'-cyclic phosphodiesterase n=1 Tax=Marinobacter metalliresistant TaxID=2961995 RepID=A0ABZ2W0V3_9GAMM|nr:RNA 2',3'-cyclic phosphodiesterase [Marinobacter sp. Arc7-DN-1]AXS84758.1 RNA 2',3'-cyclic phosphodiesterase [Marinobacter sp. Arc7-DN-1]